MAVVKTVIIPISQLVKANKIVDKIQKVVMKKYKKNYFLNVDIDLINDLKKLKDCITVEY